MPFYRRITFILMFSFALEGAGQEAVTFRDLARLTSVQDQAIVGYGVVTGLAGTGDSPRNKATMQSVHNMLKRFGVAVPADQMRSRNAAAVMVTAELPPYAQPGDQVDVNVTSLGDARSLVGGTLMLAPLAVSDREVYAMAQGPLSVGGFSYDMNGNLVQKNHPTTAYIPNGATVTTPVMTKVIGANGAVLYKLHEPSFQTADRAVRALNSRLGGTYAVALDAARIEVRVAERNSVAFLTLVESTPVVPVNPARIVVNERTGTVVSGGDIIISAVSVTHGNLSVVISTDYRVSQPALAGNFINRSDLDGIQTQVVPDTEIRVEESESVSVALPSGARVSDLVSALNNVRVTSRDIITILQGVKRAGALHADLIIQ